MVFAPLGGGLERVQIFLSGHLRASAQGNIWRLPATDRGCPYSGAVIHERRLQRCWFAYERPGGQHCGNKQLCSLAVWPLLETDCKACWGEAVTVGGVGLSEANDQGCVWRVFTSVGISLQLLPESPTMHRREASEPWGCQQDSSVSKGTCCRSP